MALARRPGGSWKTGTVRILLQTTGTVPWLELQQSAMPVDRFAIHGRVDFGRRSSCQEAPRRRSAFS